MARCIFIECGESGTKANVELLCKRYSTVPLQQHECVYMVKNLLCTQQKMCSCFNLAWFPLLQCIIAFL